jgi:hypothetical protein
MCLWAKRYKGKEMDVRLAVGKGQGVRIERDTSGEGKVKEVFSNIGLTGLEA